MHAILSLLHPNLLQRCSFSIKENEYFIPFIICLYLILKFLILLPQNIHDLKFSNFVIFSQNLSLMLLAIFLTECFYLFYL